MKTELERSNIEVHPPAESYALEDLPVRFGTLPRFPILALIRLYQKTLSPALPTNTCRFYPTCSQYSYRAIYKHGLIYGGGLALWRILRCNPFNAGGHDPVP